MYELISKLVVYRELETDSILLKLANIFKRYESAKHVGEALDSIRGTLAGEVLTEITRILDLATRYGFNHNLWHNYLSYILAMKETPFTLVSEKTGQVDGSVNLFVKKDLEIFKQLFDYDFSEIERDLGLDCFTVLQDYHAVMKKEQVYNKSVSEKVQELSRTIETADTVEEIYQVVTGFYKKYGVGKLGLNKAFRVGDHPGEELLVPITNTGDMCLEDIIGYEVQKQQLIDNTEAFVQGRKANNVLLYGDAGTGKSTSIKAILNRYYPDGLRMIEVYKHQFKQLADIINEVKNRNYRFIIYMDDLSFEEFEIEYKYLKAVIEGGLEPKPENVLIYATSNRRHLIRETWHDRQDASKEDMHKNDTVQEKLSLSARFGVQIGYFSPTPKEFQTIVEGLADRYPELKMDREELLRQANIWEVRHGGFSGRTAQQFIDYIVGQTEGD